MVGKKLLVADDSLTIQKVIRLALSNEGYDIQTVSDGNEAVQQISLQRPDVVLIDVSLPGKTAFELKRIINEHAEFGHVKFILMSSAFERVDEEQEASVRFHGRLTKPFDPAHLRQVLTDVLTMDDEPAPPAHSAAMSGPPVFEPSESFEPIAPMPSEPMPEPLPEPGTLGQLWNERAAAGEIKLQEPIFNNNTGVGSRPGIGPGSGPSFGSSPSAPPMFPPHPDSLKPAMPRSGGSRSQPAAASAATAEAQPMDFNNDIRELTESTIRMSGLDDYQWSVNEEKVRKEPSAPAPLPAPSSIGEQTLTHLRLKEPTMVPSSGLGDLGDSNFEVETQAKDLQESYEIDDPAETYRNAPSTEQTGATAYASIPPPPSPVMTSAISQAQIEEIVQRQVQQTLEKLIQRLLPEVAERVIKQEIRKLLEESS